MAEGKYDDKTAIAELQARLTELQDENLRDQAEHSMRLRTPTRSRATCSNGFDNVIAELRPLRDLAPEREPLEQPVAAAARRDARSHEGRHADGRFARNPGSQRSVHRGAAA